MKKIFLLAFIGLITAIHAQNIESWTPQSLEARFGAAHIKYVGGKVKTITFGPTKHFHSDLCFDLILEVLRGAKEASVLNASDPNLETTETVWTDHKTGIVINQLQGFVFVAVKVSDLTNGSVVLTAHLVDDSDGEWFVLESYPCATKG